MHETKDSKDSSDRMRQAEALVAALGRPELYDHPTDRIHVVETHLSWLVLTGPYAYKLKKPVALPFVDFSTLEWRREACEVEVRINRRLAPGLYVGVVGIGGSVEAPVLGAEPAIEHAVKMRQFPDDARLDRQVAAGTVAARHFEAFAERMARFHDQAAGGLADRIRREHDPNAGFVANLGELRDELAARERGSLASLEDWHARHAAALAPVFAERLARGFVREVHGDLHLENLVLIDDEIVAFDALEFSQALRSIDVIDEASFLNMDLTARGREDLGFVFLSRYLQITGDYAGLAVLRFYLAHRALVRAKVRAIAARQHDARGSADEIDYAAAARRFVGSRRPRLVLTHGLSASGKSSVAAGLVGRLGAVAIRSDLERKRLFGLGERDSSGSDVGAGIYDAQAGARTYATLERHAGRALAAGLDAIVDATCISRPERDRFRALAARQAAGFVLVDCVAPRDVLEQRIVERGRQNRDASEATLAVLERQIRTQDPLDADELATTVQVDTSADVDFAALAGKIHAVG